VLETLFSSVKSGRPKPLAAFACHAPAANPSGRPKSPKLLTAYLSPSAQKSAVRRHWTGNSRPLNFLYLPGPVLDAGESNGALYELSHRTCPLPKTFRAVIRLCFLLTLFPGGIFSTLPFCLWLCGKAGLPARPRARWLQYWADKFRKTIADRGPIPAASLPARGILACNHLSYIDILVLGSLQPFIFVSKSEVASLGQ